MQATRASSSSSTLHYVSLAVWAAAVSLVDSQGEQVRAGESRMSAVERSGMSLSRAGAAAGERMG